MGGKAFDNTRRVNRTEVFNTLVSIGFQLKVGNQFMGKTLGSAGQADSSGDIDINVDSRQFDFGVMADKITAVLGESNVKVRKGNNQIFTSWPIPNTVDDQRVQVDFMFSDNPAWQEFSYHSPGDNSAFKGLFRTELVKAAVAFNSDWLLFEDGEMVARVGPTFFHDKGLVWRHRFRPFRKDGKGRIKQFVEASAEDFKEIFPDSRPASNTVVADEQGVYALVFDDFGNDLGYGDPDLFFSYESLSAALRHHYDPHSYHEILQIYLERLNSLKVDIPKEILDEIHSGAHSQA